MTFLKSQTNKENVMRKRKKKIIAGTVVAVMMAGSIIANISPLIASQTGGNSVAASETFNKEGLWITEIYQNECYPQYTVVLVHIWVIKAEAYHI